MLPEYLINYAFDCSIFCPEAPVSAIRISEKISLYHPHIADCSPGKIVKEYNCWNMVEYRGQDANGPKMSEDNFEALFSQYEGKDYLSFDEGVQLLRSRIDLMASDSAVNEYVQTKASMHHYGSSEELDEDFDLF